MVEFRQPHRVAFHETDAAGIVHFTQFFRWFESAEHAFLEHVGIPVYQRHDAGLAGWPKVSASCDYRQPALYGDELEMQVTVARIGKSSLTLNCRCFRAEQCLAEGKTVTVWIAAGDPAVAGVEPTPITGAWRALLQPYVQEGEANE